MTILTHVSFRAAEVLLNFRAPTTTLADLIAERTRPLPYCRACAKKEEREPVYYYLGPAPSKCTTCGTADDVTWCRR